MVEYDQIALEKRPRKKPATRWFAIIEPSLFGWVQIKTKCEFHCMTRFVGEHGKMCRELRPKSLDTSRDLPSLEAAIAWLNKQVRLRVRKGFGPVQKWTNPALYIQATKLPKRSSQAA